MTPERSTVHAPELEPNALVVFAVDAPMAHVIPFLKPTPARVLGIDNGIVNALLKAALNEDSASARDDARASSLGEEVGFLEDHPRRFVAGNDASEDLIQVAEHLRRGAVESDDGDLVEQRPHRGRQLLDGFLEQRVKPVSDGL